VYANAGSYGENVITLRAACALVALTPAAAPIRTPRAASFPIIAAFFMALLFSFLTVSTEMVDAVRFGLLKRDVYSVHRTARHALPAIHGFAFLSDRKSTSEIAWSVLAWMVEREHAGTRDQDVWQAPFESEFLAAMTQTSRWPPSRRALRRAHGSVYCGEKRRRIPSLTRSNAGGVRIGVRKLRTLRKRASGLL
jgi:hypothetical protein